MYATGRLISHDVAEEGNELGRRVACRGPAQDLSDLGNGPASQRLLLKTLTEVYDIFDPSHKGTETYHHSSI